MRERFFRVAWAACAIFIVPAFVFARIPNDPYYADQWYLEAISAPEAWDVSIGSKTVIVAVLDTGIDLSHEDLADNLWKNTDEIVGNGIDDDGNGFVDDVFGWDFIDQDNDPTPETSVVDPEVASHGTLIAGEIGAIGNNMLGIAGLSWNVSIMPVRMLGDDGSGTEGNAADAIRYAVENGADVINLSFAGDEAHADLIDAVKDAYSHNVIVVAAMGNEGRDTDKTPVYPACLRSEVDDWVIGVTAITQANRGAPFTNYGTICADIAAPGTNIFGLGNDAQRTGDSLVLYQNGWSGTSMASPLVAGAASLLVARYPLLSAGDIRNILKLSVDPIRATGYLSGALGAGRLNVARALELAGAYVPSESQISDDLISPTEKPTANRTMSDDDKEMFSYSFVVFGAPAGVLPEVDVYEANGSQYARFQAYSNNFSGGVHVAVMNNDEDWIPEIVTGAGEGGGPHVRLFTAYGALIHEFFAYSPASDRGVNIAVGDVSGDGVEDIITSVGQGVSQDIVIWSADGKELSRFTASLFPVSSPLSAIAVDYDDDFAEEIAVTGIIAGVSHVALYDNDGTYLVDFVPYPEGGDVSISRVDLDGDYYDEIAVSALARANEVRVFTKIGALRGSASLVDGASLGMIVAGTDLDFDGFQDLVLYENRDGGEVTLLSSDMKTILGSFIAPTFLPSTGAFMAAW